MNLGRNTRIAGDLTTGGALSEIAGPIDPSGVFPSSGTLACAPVLAGAAFESDRVAGARAISI